MGREPTLGDEVHRVAGVGLVEDHLAVGEPPAVGRGGTTRRSASDRPASSAHSIPPVQHARTSVSRRAHSGGLGE